MVKWPHLWASSHIYGHQTDHKYAIQCNYAMWDIHHDDLTVMIDIIMSDVQVSKWPLVAILWPSGHNYGHQTDQCKYVMLGINQEDLTLMIYISYV